MEKNSKKFRDSQKVGNGPELISEEDIEKAKRMRENRTDRKLSDNEILRIINERNKRRENQMEEIQKQRREERIRKQYKHKSRSLRGKEVAEEKNKGKIEDDFER